MGGGWVFTSIVVFFSIFICFEFWGGGRAFPCIFDFLLKLCFVSSILHCLPVLLKKHYIYMYHASETRREEKSIKKMVEELSEWREIETVDNKSLDILRDEGHPKY